MSDAVALAERYVGVWNEADSRERLRTIHALWAENGMERTKSRLTRGHEALALRITASHEKNVRDAHNKFRLRRSDRNGNVVKLDWEMVAVEDGSTRATGSYVLILSEEDKILDAYFFSDS
jgi:hypothetical protein